MAIEIGNFQFKGWTRGERSATLWGGGGDTDGRKAIQDGFNFLGKFGEVVGEGVEAMGEAEDGVLKVVGGGFFGIVFSHGGQVGLVVRFPYYC